MTAVTIGPSFFQKEFKDYSNWTWAFIREALQNCIDAPKCKNIDIQITEDDNNTIIIFANDGEPMDEYTITTKLLCLGESGKNFDGSVGGFGKAKILLYFAQQSYKITTGDYIVTGAGGHYEIQKQDTHHQGTKSEVIIKGKIKGQLTNALRKFAKHAQWNGTLTYEGENLETNQHKGTFRKDLGFGKVYTNKDVIGIVCRIHGIPMFIDSYSTQKGIIIELDGNSGTRLTSNRDMLQYTYRNELASFCRLLNTDERKALKADNPEITHYPGSKCRLQLKTSSKAPIFTPQEQPVNTPQLVAALHSIHSNATGQTNYTQVAKDFDQYTIVTPQEIPYIPNRPRNNIGIDFYLRNDTRLQIPDIYKPDQMSEYATKLSQIWANVLLEAHDLISHEAPNSFSVGFLFSEDAEAMHQVRQNEVIYFLNPCKIVQDKTSTRFRKRFLLTEKERIISIAVHELVHGLGFEYHDEDYSCKLTELMAIVLKNRTKFNACFRV